MFDRWSAGHILAAKEYEMLIFYESKLVDMRRRSSRFLAVICSFLILTSGTIAASTTIEFWQFWTDSKIKPVMQNIVTDFEKQNPEIKVNLTDLTWSNGHEKIVIAFASKNAPDIIELGSDWLAQFADAGQLSDLTEETQDYKNDFHGWGMATYDSKVYGWPWILGTRVMFFNRDLLNKAGYDSSFIPIKLTEFLKAAYKVDSLGSDINGWGSNTAEKHRLYKKFLPFLWSYGGQLFSDDGRFSLVASDYMVNALKFYKEIHDSCGFVSNQRGIEDRFLEGKIGFILSGDWLLKRIELGKLKINFSTTLMPGLRLPGKSFLGGEILVIPKSSTVKEAALKFIRFLTSADNQLKFCKANLSATPSNKSARKDEYFESNEHLQVFSRQILHSRHSPVDPNWVVIESIIENVIEEVLFGDSELIAEPLLKAKYKIEALNKK